MSALMTCDRECNTDTHGNSTRSVSVPMLVVESFRKQKRTEAGLRSNSMPSALQQAVDWSNPATLRSAPEYTNIPRKCLGAYLRGRGALTATELMGWQWRGCGVSCAVETALDEGRHSMGHGFASCIVSLVNRAASRD